jgi:ABC-type multidrug transport system ATPase subunit
MTVLEINNISKRYGAVQALNNVSFSVPQGTVYGILGPNGSGKTTLLGIIMDILKANTGTIKLFDQEPNNIQRKKIGTLLETPNFYHYLNAVENLKIAAAIKEIENPDIDGVLRKVNLEQRKLSKFQTYSLGMKQRLAIAACLLGNPQILVFDEPTNGLDPVGIKEIRDLITKLWQEGNTIIMASHMLDEVEKVCTHVAILKKGNLLTSGAVNEILTNEDIAEFGAADNVALQQALNIMHGVTRTEVSGDKVLAYFPIGTARLDDVNKHCFNEGIILSHMQMKKKSLESKFFELTNEIK